MELSPEFLSQNSSGYSSWGSINNFILDGETSKIPLSYAFRSSEGCALLKMLNLLLKCIDQINHNIKQVDTRMVFITKQLNELKEKAKLKMIRGKPMQTFFAPYFRDARKRCPPLNDVCKEKIARKDFDAYWKPAIPWAPSEWKVLLKLIHEVGEESVLKPLYLKQSFLKNKYTNITDEAEREEIQNKIDKLHIKEYEIKLLPFEEIVQHPDCKLDWLLIFCKMNDLSSNRTLDECERIWNNLLHPAINKDEFTIFEDRRLRRFAMIYYERNWKFVASDLRSNRTAVQCMMRYQRYHNKNLTRRCWTQEEDYKLIYYVKNLRIGDYIPWGRILYFIPGKTWTRTHERWEHYLKPQKRDYTWTDEEDAILHLAIAVYKQSSWTKISKLMNGRNKLVCKYRYLNTLDPTLLFGDWSDEDDRGILKYLAEYGEKFAEISEHFPGRNSQRIRLRCQMIRRHCPEVYAKVLRNGRAYNLPGINIGNYYIYTNDKSKREEIRNNAFALTKAAAEKVLGHIIDFSNCHEFDDLGSLINVASLELIATELLSKEVVELKRPLLRYYRPPKIPMFDSDTSSEDYFSDEEDDYDVKEDIEMQRESQDCNDYTYDTVFYLPKDFDFKAFTAEFDRRIIPNAVTIKRQFINILEKPKYVGYSFLMHHIFQLYHVNMPREFDITEVPSVCYGVDYSKMIPFVMDTFVMANTGEESLPIMPPNHVTLKGAKMLLLIHEHVKEWMENVTEESHHFYNSFVTRAPNGKVLCTYCTQRLEHEIPSEETNENMEVDNKDESLCTCKVVLETRQKWITFFYRMTVFFLWPLLLCSKIPTSEQLLNFIVIPKEIKMEKYWEYVRRMRRWKMKERPFGERKRKYNNKPRRWQCYSESECESDNEYGDDEYDDGDDDLFLDT